MDDQENTSATEERRRDIYLRAIARFEARGTPIDKDPRFAAMIESWIAGHVEMADIAKAYDVLRRSNRQRGGTSVEGLKAEQEITSSEEKLFEDIDGGIHLHQPET